MRLSPKYRLPIWQISFPISLVLIFAIGAITTIFLVQGRYLFNLEATPQKIKITTDIDKRELPFPDAEILEEQD